MTHLEAQEISRDRYQSFLETVPHAVFHRLEWLAVMTSIYPIDILPLGYFCNDDLVAVTPLLRRRLGPLFLWGAPLRKCPVPAATPFCAPAKMSEVILPVLREWVRCHRIGYMQVTLPPPVDNAVFVANRVEILENLELSLSGPLEELWHSLSKKTRYTVRRAVKDGVKVHWHFSADILDTQALLLHDTYGRQGRGARPNYPLALYRALLEARQVTGLRILCATYGNRIIAAVWLFTDARKCYYWDAAASSEGRRFNTNHLLVWCLIRWARRRGLETLDFVGAGKGRMGERPGIGRFKRSFGARPVEYRIVYWHSLALGTALTVYRALSRLRRMGLVNWRRTGDENN